MRTPTIVAVTVVALLASTANALAQASRDENVLERNPLKAGLSDWRMSGSEKAFSWDEEDKELEIQGQSGKEAHRLVYGLLAWDTFEFHFRVRKGARKLTVVMAPPGEKGPGDEVVSVEVPKNSVSKERWNDLVLQVDGGHWSLKVGEEEVATGEVPLRSRWHVGFEAPSGARATVTGFRILRRYENPPQFAEEGFRSVFDGSTRELWAGNGEESDRLVSVANGCLVTEVRGEKAAMVAFLGGSLNEYELRFRVLWGSTGLVFRALEVPGMGGQISKMQSVQLNLSDHLDPLDVSDVVILLEKKHCTITVNGKKVHDAPTASYESTPISFQVMPGKRCAMRDIRIRVPGEKGSGAADDAPDGK